MTGLSVEAANEIISKRRGDVMSQWHHEDRILQQLSGTASVLPHTQRVQIFAIMYHNIIMESFYLYSVPTEYEHNMAEFAFMWTGSATFALRINHCCLERNSCVSPYEMWLVETLMCTEGQWNTIGVLYWESNDRSYTWEQLGLSKCFKNRTFLTKKVMTGFFFPPPSFWSSV